MKKVNKIAALIAGICLINAGCAVHNEESKEPQGMVTLQVCIAESQWDQSIDGLTKLYLKEHPEIKDIEWILVRQNSYWDLMDMKLATGTLPDIMEAGAGEKLREWSAHLVQLDDLPVLTQMFPDVVEAGKIDGHYYSVPDAIYGMGILYNMELLKQAGWERVPRTKSQLKQLCEDLEKKDIFQFMNPYHEINTWVENGLLQMTALKPDPKLYIRRLKKNTQKPIVDDPDWQALFDFCDLTLEYGNRRPLQLDTDLARNYFYIGRYAMILNESARDLSGMKEAGQGVDQVTQIGPMLLSDNAEKNPLLMDTVRFGVTRNSKHQKEAKEFINWMSGDSGALAYQKENMGIMPVIASECQTGLCSMAKDTYEYYTRHKMTDDLMGYLPIGIAETTSEEWARYITGEIDRDELLAVYEKYWDDYSKQE